MNPELQHYNILRTLGAGGMGEVFLAEDARLHRKVALKFLSREAAQDREHRQRFLREARAAAALNHPGICTIHEVGETEDGRPFIALEWLEGSTLEAQPRSGKYEMGDILAIGCQAAEALREAHEKGVIHRDIKPANMHWDDKGRLKLLDFGLAKVMEEREIGEDAPTELQTMTGHMMGTPRYMSPEQALGQKVDSRTDLFSLGAVL